MHEEMHITEAQAVYLEKFLNFRGNIAELAAAMDIPLVDMIDILSAPAVQKRIKAAAKLTKLRRKMIVADIEITALETLEQVAANKYADVVERRRAAAAILRALHKPKRRRSRATNLIRSRGQCPQTDPNDDPPDDPGGSSDQTAQNAAIYCPQEFLDELHEARKNSPASNMTKSEVCTSDLVDSEALYPQDETTKLLEETTQALIELDEVCAQDDESDFDPTPRPNTSSNSNSQSRGIGVPPVPASSSHSVPSPTPHPGPGGANDSCHGWSADEVETEPVENEHNNTVPEGRTKRTQTQDASHPPQHPNHNKPNFTNPTIQNEPIPTPDQTLDDYDPETGLTTPINIHTSKHQQKDKTQSPPPSAPSRKPYPEKDNPWESHPFARAGRSSTHDPP